MHDYDPDEDIYDYDREEILKEEGGPCSEPNQECCGTMIWQPGGYFQCNRCGHTMPEESYFGWQIEGFPLEGFYEDLY